MASSLNRSYVVGFMLCAFAMMDLSIEDILHALIDHLESFDSQREDDDASLYFHYD